MDFFCQLAAFLTSCIKPQQPPPKGRAACVLPKRQNPARNHLLLLVKLKCCECTVITEGDSDEHFNILINSERLPSGFWRVECKRTQFSGLLVN